MIAIMMNYDAAVLLRAHSSRKIGAYVENTSGASGSSWNLRTEIIAQLSARILFS